MTSKKSFFLKTINFIGIFLVLVSFSFVLTASISKRKLPEWVGFADAIVAFSIVGLSFLMYLLISSEQNETKRIASYKAFPIIFQIISIVLGGIFFLMWLKRADIDFNILLPGLAWRIFIILYSIPYSVYSFSIGGRFH